MFTVYYREIFSIRFASLLPVKRIRLALPLIQLDNFVSAEVTFPQKILGTMSFADMRCVTDITSENIKVFVNPHGVGLLYLDRPGKRNAFSQEMIDTMVVALEYFDKSAGVRAAVVTGGADGPFCAGMDLRELAKISTAEAHQRKFLKDLTDAFAHFSKPTIAAVVGFAVSCPPLLCS